MSINKVNIYSHLKSERKRLGYSQADMATECSVSREMWGKYERGESIPGGEVFFHLFELGADVNYILSGKRGVSFANHEMPSYNGAEIDLIVDAFKNTDDVGKKALIAVAASLIRK
jgi:transcriptional regulator with XRE-family HTH domain